MTNAFAAALGAGRFCYVVELVASAMKREAQVLEIAAGLAMVPEVVAGSVTSYAGGRFGQDPVRVASAVRARGLTPNIHLTCVYDDRKRIAKNLKALQALELFNVFAITGDYPTQKDAKALFDIDSIQLIDMIARMREEQGVPFHISVAVSPFKYAREDCLYQYLKLEKKVAAGANVAITQVGWDARKFVELKRYLDERGIVLPLLGNVYVLSKRAAEKMATGSPPGCWASPELVETVRKESEAPDGNHRGPGGLNARLERAAQTVAVLKGLGYAGAYIGGTHDRAGVARIITLARTQGAGRVCRGAPIRQKGRFYLYDSRAGGGAADGRRGARRHGQLLPSPATRRSGVLTSVSEQVDRRPLLRHLTERFEYVIKRPMFGCGRAATAGHIDKLPERVQNRCETARAAYHAHRCRYQEASVSVYQRAEAAQCVPELKTVIPAPDRTLQGTSSWINYFLGRDSRPRGDVAKDSKQSLISVRGGYLP